MQVKVAGKARGPDLEGKALALALSDVREEGGLVQMVQQRPPLSQSEAFQLDGGRPPSRPRPQVGHHVADPRVRGLPYDALRPHRLLLHPPLPLFSPTSPPHVTTGELNQEGPFSFCSSCGGIDTPSQQY